jgi:ABC-type sugar transport system substrate-binding protein
MSFRRRPGVGPSRAVTAAVAAIGAATLIAACSSSGSSSSSSGATSTSSAKAAGETAIGVDLTYNNTAFWSAYINYETQYAAQLHIRMIGPLLAGANANLQNTQIENLVNEGAKAIIVNPETATSLGPPRAAGVRRHHRRRRQGVHGGPRVQHAVRPGRLRRNQLEGQVRLRA